MTKPCSRCALFSSFFDFFLSCSFTRFWLLRKKGATTPSPHIISSSGRRRVNRGSSSDDEISRFRFRFFARRFTQTLPYLARINASISTWTCCPRRVPPFRRRFPCRPSRGPPPRLDPSPQPQPPPPLPWPPPPPPRPRPPL